MTDMDIVVNGEARRVAERSSLLDLLETLGLDPRTVLIVLNREMVRRPGLGETVLAAGDAVELVLFVGGG